MTPPLGLPVSQRKLRETNNQLVTSFKMYVIFCGVVVLFWELHNERVQAMSEVCSCVLYILHIIDHAKTDQLKIKRVRLDRYITHVHL